MRGNRNFARFARLRFVNQTRTAFPETAAAMTRSAKNLLVLSLALATLAVCSSRPADARRRASAPDSESEKAAPDKADISAPGKPVQVGTYGDWGAYLAKGKAKTCYALAMPKDRKPDGKKDAAYVFIADRPAEKVHNEVSIMMGFPIKESGAAQAKVGAVSFDLVAKGSNAWIKNPADEAKFVDALKHTAKLTVTAPSMKGKATTDTYSLAGIKQALERVGKDCK